MGYQRKTNVLRLVGLFTYEYRGPRAHPEILTSASASNDAIICPPSLYVCVLIHFRPLVLIIDESLGAWNASNEL